MTSYLHVTMENWGTIGILAGLLHSLFQAVGLFAVPIGICTAVMRIAERRFGATPPDVKLVTRVAVILYVVHLPLLLILWLLTGLTRWPWY
ncbi:MAG: hypothetical protein U0893_24830 [Chloroflexota bacterium]